jgi:hypothetical protein
MESEFSVGGVVGIGWVLEEHGLREKIQKNINTIIFSKK